MPEVITTKKLSLKTMGVKGKAVCKLEAGTKLPLAVIMGVAYASTTGESDLGTYNALEGEFEGIRLSDGQRFSSNVCYLPGGLERGICAVLNRPDAKQVAFALEVSAVNDELNETNQIGFFYAGRDVTQTQEANPLAGLRAKVAAANPKLLGAAPSTVEEKQDAALEEFEKTEGIKKQRRK
jgi:hypothetical protein